MHKKRPKQSSLGAQSRKHLIIPRGSRGKRFSKVHRREAVNQEVEDAILPSGKIRREIQEESDKKKLKKKDKQRHKINATFMKWYVFQCVWSIGARGRVVREKLGLDAERRSFAPPQQFCLYSRINVKFSKVFFKTINGDLISFGQKILGIVLITKLTLGVWL